MDGERIYLDYAAATPTDARVFALMAPYFSEKFYNPSAAYLSAKNVRDDFENARHEIAQTIGAKSAEIIFTAGATESINIALGGVAGGILTLATEHDSVLNFAKNRANSVVLDVNEKGEIDLEKIAKTLAENDEISLVSICYANNEIGVVAPLKDVAKIVQNARKNRQKSGNKTPLFLHTDASQAGGFLDVNVARLGVDLMTLNAAKMGGPKQVGLLYVRAGVRLEPRFFGGGQEMNLRSGTENVAGAIGFAAAMKIAEKSRNSEAKRLAKLRDELAEFLRAEFGAALKINSCAKNKLPNVLNFSLENLDGERAVFALDLAGVEVSTGSACAANSGRRSHVLTAIGLNAETADGSLRVSLGHATTAEEIARAKPIFAGVLREQLKFGSQSSQNLRGGKVS